MATLKDLWNYPNNPSNGYMSDSANWSGDASFGADKRVEDLLTGTYKAWPGQNPRTDLGTTLSAGNTAIAQYTHYLDSFSDDANLTFRKMYNHEMVEWTRGHTGVFVEKIELITDGTVSTPSGSNNLVKVTTTTPHNFSNGDRLQGFGFRDMQGSVLSTLNYEEDIYAKVVDSTSFTLFSNSGLTTGWTNGRSNFIAPLTNYYLLDYKGTHTYLCFSEIGRTAGSHDQSLGSQSGAFVAGDKVKISTAHTGLTGTINGSVGDEWTITEVGDDTGRETDQVHAKSYLINKTITSETNYATTLSYDITSSGSRVNIEVDLTDSSYAALRTQLMTYHMHNDNYNIYQVNDGIHDSSAPSPIAGGTGSGMGFCRVSLTQGTTASTYTGGGAWDSNSDKPIKSSLDTEYFYNWTYDDTTKMLKVYENALGTTRNQLGASHSGNIQGEIQFINFWTQAQTGPNGYSYGTYAGAITHGASSYNSAFTEYPVITIPENVGDGSTSTNAFTVGWQGIDNVANDSESIQKQFDATQPGGTATPHISRPMIGLYNSFVPSATRFFNTWPEPDDVKLGINPSPTAQHWLGAQKYTYQNSSNVTTNGAGNINFNTVYQNDASTVTSLTWTDPPVITPGVDSNGYLDGTYTVTNRGALSWTSLGITNNADIIAKLNAPSDSIYITGSYKFQQRADEYTAPTPYAEDVWDTDDEWDTTGFSGIGYLKQWPKHITPSSIKVIQATPSSVTTSQSGIKYVRSSGIIRHQLEVTYPPMTETDFRTFEATHAAARGQASPMYFDFIGYGNDGTQTIAFGRTDANRTSAGPYPVKEATAAAGKTLLLEGFFANSTNVVLKGEFMVGGEADGGLIQAVSTTDSNVFGEAKFRMAVGARNGYSVGNNVYKNPLHAIVTIAEDTLEYSIGTDQLYRFTVRFDWDEWK